MTTDSIKELVKRLRDGFITMECEDDVVRYTSHVAADALEALAGEVERLTELAYGIGSATIPAWSASKKHAELPNKMLGEAEAECDRLAGEVAFVKAQLAGTNKNIAGWLQARDDAMKRAEAAEAERDRLKVALQAIEQGDYYGCVSEFALKALGGDA